VLFKEFGVLIKKVLNRGGSFSRCSSLNCLRVSLTSKNSAKVATKRDSGRILSSCLLGGVGLSEEEVSEVLSGIYCVHV
jgi:hypothetical protein